MINPKGFLTKMERVFFNRERGGLLFYSLSINSFRPELHLIRTVNETPFFQILPLLLRGSYSANIAKLGTRACFMTKLLEEKRVVKKVGTKETSGLKYSFSF